MKPTLRLTLLAFASVASLSAQDTPPVDASAPVMLSEFHVEDTRDTGYHASNTVGGTRTATAIKDIPMAIDVLTSDFIRDIGSFELEDAVRYNASAVEGGTGADNTTFVIRGFETAFSLRNGFRRLELVDGVNIDRVEVVKGPASVLYGTIEPGGVVNYVTKRPTSKRQTVIATQAGSFGYYRAQIDHGGPLGTSGRFAYRLNTAYETRDSFRDHEESEKFVVAPVFNWRISERTNLLVDFEVIKRKGTRGSLYPVIRSVAKNVFQFSDLGRSFSANTPDSFADFNAYSFTAELEHRFNDWVTLRQAVSAYNRDRDIFGYGSGQAQDANPGNPALRNFRTLTRGSSRNYQANDNLFNQTELVFRYELFGGSFRTLTGYEWRRDEFEANSLVSNNAATGQPASWNLQDPSTWLWSNRGFDLFRLSSSSEQVNTVHGFYLSNQAAFMSNRLRLMLGLRHDSYENESLNVLNGATGGDDGSATTPQAGVLFRATPGAAFYVSYSESFRPLGGLRRNVDFSQSPYDPISGEGVEAGLKLDLLDGKVSANIAVFNIVQNNIPRNVTVPETDEREAFSANVQSGEETSEGFEFNINASPVRGLQFLGGYAYTDARTTSNVQQPELVGIELQNVPRHKATLWTRYSFQAGRLQGLNLGLGVIYVDERRALAATTDPLFMDEYTLLNASIGYNWRRGDRRYSLNVNADNLLDEFFYRNRFAPGEPLSVRGTFRVSF